MNSLVTNPDNPRFARWSAGLPSEMHPRVKEGLQSSMYSLTEAAARFHRNRMNAPLAWAAAVESVWWILAMDESFTDAVRGDYKRVRDNDEFGQYLNGFRWLRNRHAHEMAISANAGPARHFNDPPSGSGAMGFISPSVRWKPTTEIHAPNDQNPTFRPKYDELIAGKPVGFTLERAQLWFDRILCATEIEWPLERPDQTVLG